MILRAIALAAVTVTLMSGCACTDKWAYYPNTLPFTLPDIAPGAHLTESQAIDLATEVAVYHRRNPAHYGTPTASFQDGQWFVHFNLADPSQRAFGTDFAIFIYERDNKFSFSPGR